MSKQGGLFDETLLTTPDSISMMDPFKGGKPKKEKKSKPKKEKPARLPLLPPNPKFVKGLLALDIATDTGFCTSTASGVWHLVPKKDESKGMRLIRFIAKVKEVCRLEGINMIVFEQIAVYGKYPNTVAMEMVGVLKLFCEENNIDYKAYPVKSIKMQTGNGNAGKDEMVAFVQRYKPGVTDDNEADAIVLYQLAVHDLNL
jgi:Holliday junction resolvasome RuvABC endonuclease subunit